MKHNLLQMIEYEVALLARLTTSCSPRFGSLDRSEYLLLNEFQEKNSLAINTLAGNLKLTLSTTSRQVATLERKKFVQRLPDPKNGRISLIKITSKGQELLQKVQNVRREAYAEILHDWSKEELEVLERQLTRMNKEFRKLRK
ncbi:DNA-binding MarR family transcriptional regulator [Bacillus aryabhattai]|uniref:DNA-binding MarR family transcriptional regulator n=1 Tax=Priestia aryabhattai TaxID=412384 RepID=A0A7W3NGA0_PRIAR|nr:MarR family transcriptional regulator [Priestia aryabhattai]MBA9042430.1 DNA-binding MarR family transcriptional regulator [Priestia aryabhattai]